MKTVPPFIQTQYSTMKLVWVPVAERLPENDLSKYLVTDSMGYCAVCVYSMGDFLLDLSSFDMKEVRETIESTAKFYIYDVINEKTKKKTTQKEEDNLLYEICERYDSEKKSTYSLEVYFQEPAYWMELPPCPPPIEHFETDGNEYQVGVMEKTFSIFEKIEEKLKQAIQEVVYKELNK